MGVKFTKCEIYGSTQLFTMDIKKKTTQKEHGFKPKIPSIITSKILYGYIPFPSVRNISINWASQIMLVARFGLRSGVRIFDSRVWHVVSY